MFKRLKYPFLLLFLVGANLVLFSNCSKPSSPSSPANKSANTPPPATSPQAFTFLDKSLATCPEDAATCASYWPLPSDGVVYQYRFSEKSQFTPTPLIRTTYVYVPSRVTTPSPVVLLLHGGNGSGLTMMKTTNFLSLADQRGSSAGVSWQKNTATCQYEKCTKILTNTCSYHKVSNGTACSPPQSTFFNSQGFILVLPDGVADVGDNSTLPPRHWEDGRIPSPGFNTEAQNRDDVGFINAVIAEVKTQEQAKSDPERIYVAGISNGGIMTTRLICNSSNSNELNGVAAFAVIVASIPQTLITGQSNREPCPALATGHQVPVILLVGYGLDTADCGPMGCALTPASGDTRMPYGTLGTSHYVNSPDSGLVISSPDTQNAIQEILGTVASASKTTLNVGYFTVNSRYTWPASNALFSVYETDGGRHEALSTRMDFSPTGRVLDFIFSYRRVAGQTQPVSGASGLTGAL